MAEQSEKDLLDHILGHLRPKQAVGACAECGDPKARSGCGLCLRLAQEAAEEARAKGDDPGPVVVVPLCAIVDRPECTSKHAREKHPSGLLGETDPQWRGRL